MRKQRKPIHLIGYDAKVKDAGSKEDPQWRIIGRYKTIDLARVTVPGKITPRYSRG